MLSLILFYRFVNIHSKAYRQCIKNKVRIVQTLTVFFFLNFGFFFKSSKFWLSSKFGFLYQKKKKKKDNFRLSVFVFCSVLDILKTFIFFSLKKKKRKKKLSQNFDDLKKVQVNYIV